MNLFENLRIALRAITANKLRSGLTMLGIIIGVGAVVALMSIGKGATKSVTSRVENLAPTDIDLVDGRILPSSERHWGTALWLITMPW